MVRLCADAITLCVEDSLDISLDKSLLLTGKSDRIHLVVAKLRGDAFFMNICLSHSKTDLSTTWDVNFIVEPRVTKVTIFPTYSELHAAMNKVHDVGRAKGLVHLTPGQTSHISKDVAVHLVSQRPCQAKEYKLCGREWYLPERYHILSPWPRCSDMAPSGDQCHQGLEGQHEREVYPEERVTTSSGSNPPCWMRDMTAGVWNIMFAAIIPRFLTSTL